MATPTHAGRAHLCRAHIYHPPALPGAAEASCQPHTRGAPLWKALGGGQPPAHRVPWPRTGLGQLRPMLGGNLCQWEQQLL